MDPGPRKNLNNQYKMSSLLRSTNQKLTRSFVVSDSIDPRHIYAEVDLVNYILGPTSANNLSAVPKQLGNIILMATSQDVYDFASTEFETKDFTTVLENSESLLDLGSELIVKAADTNGTLLRFRLVERSKGSVDSNFGNTNAGYVLVENRSGQSNLLIRVSRV